MKACRLISIIQLTVKVTINKDEPSYEILATQAYDFIAAQQLDPANSYSIIYHRTLACDPISEQALNGLKARHSGKVFLDVNLRAPWWHKEPVNQWLSIADWVELNQDELTQLVPSQNTLQDAMRVFLSSIRSGCFNCYLRRFRRYGD